MKRFKHSIKRYDEYIYHVNNLRAKGLIKQANVIIDKNILYTSVLSHKGYVYQHEFKIK